MTHNIMLDLETLSVCPRAAFFSIAMVYFNPDGEPSPIEPFFENIGLESVVGKLAVDGSTLQFWLERSEVYHSLMREKPPVNFTTMVRLMEKWLFNIGRYFETCNMPPSKFIVWSMGTDFDPQILSNALRTGGFSEFWKYNDKMDVRTLCNFLNIDKHQEMEDLPYYVHHPLIDCKRQVKLVQEAWRLTHDKEG